MNMENEVPQAQEVMTDEEMAGMDLHSYSTSKYPAQSKKRKQKSSKKEAAKKRQADYIPLQDIDTNDLLKDLGFEVIEEGQQENPPTMQTIGAGHEEPLECFIHECKLEKCTSQTGWEYVRCPMADCFIFTGLDRVNHYLKYVQDQIPVWYKWNKEKLKCFCSQPLVLCQSRSEKNPDRMYFKCQRNRCKFFQWGNEIPSGKNMGWLRGSEQVGCESPAPMYENTLNVISESGPLLSVTGKDPMWDEVLATCIMVVDRTNEIVSPAELKGYQSTPCNREALLQYLYLTRKLNAPAKAAHPRQVKIHQKAVARGLSG